MNNGHSMYNNCRQGVCLDFRMMPLAIFEYFLREVGVTSETSMCFCIFAQACDVLGKPQRSLAYLLQLYCGVSTNKIYQVLSIFRLNINNSLCVCKRRLIAAFLRVELLPETNKHGWSEGRLESAAIAGGNGAVCSYWCALLTIHCSTHANGLDPSL